MTNKKEIMKLVTNLNAKFPGTRTPEMLNEWVTLLDHFPLKVAYGIAKRITREFNFFPSIEKMLSIADQVSEQIKLNEQHKPAMTNADIFNYDRLKKDFRTDVAEVYCSLLRRHNWEFTDDLYKEMIQLDAQHPGIGLKECGEYVLRKRSEREESKSKRREAQDKQILDAYKKNKDKPVPSPLRHFEKL